MTKVTVEYTWHLVGDSISDGYDTIEDFHNQYIIHATGNAYHSVSEDISNFWQEALVELMVEHVCDIKHGVVYRTAFQMDVQYHTDYWGEVDADYTTELLAHEEVCSVDDYLGVNNNIRTEDINYMLETKWR